MGYNGAHIELAAAAAAEEEEAPAPIIGARRCRITRPLRMSPDYSGRWGRAWRVNLEAARRRAGLQSRDAVVVHWVVEAPWSSEVVHSYSLILTHLRHALSFAPVTRYLEGATHEFALIAISPEADRESMLRAPVEGGVWLMPEVFAAQIIAASDEAGAQRVGHLVELICSGRLSPHPTHFRAWVQLLGDNMLRASRARLQPEEEA